jgi:hypothetical protein
MTVRARLGASNQALAEKPRYDSTRMTQPIREIQDVDARALPGEILRSPEPPVLRRMLGPLDAEIVRPVKAYTGRRLKH